MQYVYTSIFIIIVMYRNCYYLLLFLLLLLLLVVVVVLVALVIMIIILLLLLLLYTYFLTINLKFAFRLKARNNEILAHVRFIVRFKNLDFIIPHSDHVSCPLLEVDPGM